MKYLSLFLMLTLALVPEAAAHSPLPAHSRPGVPAGAMHTTAVDSAGVFISITDVPDDQGGKVLIRWGRVANDSPGSIPQVATYSVWRKVPPAAARARRRSAPLTLAADSSGDLYDYLGSVPALDSAFYSFVAPTLEDSGPSGPHYETFRVTAHTTDPVTFQIAAEDSGCSVDNISPAAPSGLLSAVEAGPEVALTWNAPADSDVESYYVYRSTDSLFVPAPLLNIGVSFVPSFTDELPQGGTRNYYRVVAVDIHGNLSPPSDIVSALVSELRQAVGVIQNWNIVSVPVTAASLAKTDLFPAAVSNAFTYNGSYIRSDTLQYGAGYWMRFAAAGEAIITGYFITVDTIPVAAGWNMIGSISSPVPVASVTSVPGGLVTSGFFGYNGAYYLADSLEPGQGYWVKSAQPGKLILMTGAQQTSPARIHIVPDADRPPPPPDPGSADGAGVPEAYRLSQNYPNPFNPSTMIGYGLSVESRVSLTVYDVLGRRVATLLRDAVRPPGMFSVEWRPAIAGGVYFYRLDAQSTANGTSWSETRKMLFVK